MEIISTNRLRVTLSDPRKYHLPNGIGRYYSRDHGMPRRETNWDVIVGRFWLHIKWRPDGKRVSP